MEYKSNLQILASVLIGLATTLNVPIAHALLDLEERKA